MVSEAGVCNVRQVSFIVNFHLLALFNINNLTCSVLAKFYCCPCCRVGRGHVWFDRCAIALNVTAVIRNFECRRLQETAALRRQRCFPRRTTRSPTLLRGDSGYLTGATRSSVASFRSRSVASSASSWAAWGAMYRRLSRAILPVRVVFTTTWGCRSVHRCDACTGLSPAPPIFAWLGDVNASSACVTLVVSGYSTPDIASRPTRPR